MFVYRDYTVMVRYRSESWTSNRDKSKVNTVEMRSLRNKCKMAFER